MSVLNRDEYFSALHNMVGDDTSDDAIAFLENMSDTYNELENRANGDGENWKEKYNALDESWKKRYRHRFFTGSGGNPSDPEKDEKGADDITVDDLFK